MENIKVNIREIGKLKFYSSDLQKEVSIIEFLFELLLKLWEELDEFSGKRPFGNSSWCSDMMVCLIKNGVISGKLDEDGYIEDFDEESGHHIILSVIKELKEAFK